MVELYNMFFKRKSFRRFDDSLNLSKEEFIIIKEKIGECVPLVKDINMRFKLVPRSNTTCKRGEYCLLIYSEKKNFYLLNIGYIFEQLDLFFASINIGVCWYGMGRVQENSYEGLDFVIMLALGKASSDSFRKDYTKCARKKTSDIWSGDLLSEIGEIVKYAPSACNSQPWRVVCKDNVLKVFRETNIKSIIPKNKIPFYNSIDLGVFLLFLEICLEKKSFRFNRELIENSEINHCELVPVAVYDLK